MKQQLLEEEIAALRREIKTLKRRREFWLVKGTITERIYGDKYKVGDVEWQMSDGPSGERSCSADFADIEEALRFASGAIIHFE